MSCSDSTVGALGICCTPQPCATSSIYQEFRHGLRAFYSYSQTQFNTCALLYRKKEVHAVFPNTDYNYSIEVPRRGGPLILTDDGGARQLPLPDDGSNICTVNSATSCHEQYALGYYDIVLSLPITPAEFRADCLALWDAAEPEFNAPLESQNKVQVWNWENGVASFGNIPAIDNAVNQMALDFGGIGGGATCGGAGAPGDNDGGGYLWAATLGRYRVSLTGCRISTSLWGLTGPCENFNNGQRIEPPITTLLSNNSSLEYRFDTFNLSSLFRLLVSTTNPL